MATANERAIAILNNRLASKSSPPGARPIVNLSVEEIAQKMNAKQFQRVEDVVFNTLAAVGNLGGTTAVDWMEDVMVTKTHDMANEVRAQLTLDPTKAVVLRKIQGFSRPAKLVVK